MALQVIFRRLADALEVGKGEFLGDDGAPAVVKLYLSHVVLLFSNDSSVF